MVVGGKLALNKQPGALHPFWLFDRLLGYPKPQFSAIPSPAASLSTATVALALLELRIPVANIFVDVISIWID